MGFDHVLLAARLALFHLNEGDVETGRVHVVRAVLMAQRAQSFRTRQRQVVQFQLVPLLPASRGWEDQPLSQIRWC